METTTINANNSINNSNSNEVMNATNSENANNSINKFNSNNLMNDSYSHGYKITTIETILKSGKEILFIRANRETAINCKNVVSKMKSLKEYGVLIPLLLLPAQVAADENLTLLDERMNIVEDKDRIANAYVILDGNNRYRAYKNIKVKVEQAIKNGKYYDEWEMGLNDIVCIIQKTAPKCGVVDALSAINTAAVVWSPRDFIRSSATLYPDDEICQFMYSLSTDGVPISTISLYLTFNKIITLKSVANRVKGCRFEDEAYYDKIKLPRAKTIYDTLKKAGFKQKVLNSRYLIEYIRDSGNYENMLLAVTKLSPDEVTYICEHYNEDDAFYRLDEYFNEIEEQPSDFSEKSQKGSKAESNEN